MSRCRLSIVIPTINRVDYLKILLTEILPVATNSQVEVCVSANKCSDSTHAFLKKIEKDSGCFNVKYHDELLTIDQNMLSAIGMASSDYILPLGDDDFITKESVLNILALVSNVDHDLILLNCVHTDENLKKVRGHFPSKLLGVSFDCPRLAFGQLWELMPFGSFVISSECFNFDFSSRYLGTSHAYTGVVWDSLAEKNKRGLDVSIYCMIDETVYLRGAIKTWNSNRAVILFFEIPLWFGLIASNEIYWDVANKCLCQYQRGITSPKSVLLNYYGAKDYELLRSMPLINSCRFNRLLIRILDFLPRDFFISSLCFFRVFKKA
jgi:glycosyltransferase involved in cell wall biosynthesis